MALQRWRTLAFLPSKDRAPIRIDQPKSQGLWGPRNVNCLAYGCGRVQGGDGNLFRDRCFLVRGTGQELKPVLWQRFIRNYRSRLVQPNCLRSELLSV